MKNMILLAACFCMFCIGCYEDKGNYDYAEEKELIVRLVDDRVSYDISLGSTLRIPTEILSDYAKEELEFVWEIYYADEFRTLAEGESLECVFGPSEYIPSAGTYLIRLMVTHIPTGIQSFSDQITVHVTGSTTGLLVLHGDSDSCDIALVRASEFLGTEPVEPLELQFFPDWYSFVNGEKIDGEGVSVIHSYTSDTDPERCYVVALTRKGGVCADYESGLFRMTYDDLFWGGLNKHEPEAFLAIDTKEVAFDGGDVFVNGPSEAAYGAGSLFFSTPFVPVERNYSFAPYLFEVDGYNYGADAILFDRNSSSFVQVQGFWGGTVVSSLIEVGSGRFALTDLNADLVYMDKGGLTGHHVAVMKDRNDGSIFALELNFEADLPDNIPYARYDYGSMTNIGQASFFAFGDDNPNMCYCSAGNSIFKYTLLSDASRPHSSLLTMVDGRTTLTFDGEITMMKILKPNEVYQKFSYYLYNKVMVVGTWDGTEGVLHAYELDENGNVQREICSVAGLSRIVDAAIKGL